MRYKLLAAIAAVSLPFVPNAAFSGTNSPSVATHVSPQAIAKIVPGHSTKADVKALFGAPWRIVQFNDCGEAMDDQADEIWEYRGSDANGPFRLHIEFSESAAVHLIAKIPDNSSGGKGTVAKSTPSSLPGNMSM
jgi:hypothetical protein